MTWWSATALLNHDTAGTRDLVLLPHWLEPVREHGAPDGAATFRYTGSHDAGPGAFRPSDCAASSLDGAWDTSPKSGPWDPDLKRRSLMRLRSIAFLMATGAVAAAVP